VRDTHFDTWRVRSSRNLPSASRKALEAVERHGDFQTRGVSRESAKSEAFFDEY